MAVGVRKLVEQCTALLEITRQLAAETDANALLTLIVTRTTQLMNAERSTVYLIDEQRGELWAKIAEQVEATEIRLRVDGPGVAAYVARTGETVNLDNAYQDARFNSEIDQRTGWATRSMLVMPLRNQGHLVGVFQVMNRREGPFTQSDQNLLASLAASAAVAIENTGVRKQQREPGVSPWLAQVALSIQVDEEKKAAQVAAITETDYFRTLQAKALRMRDLRRQHHRTRGAREPQTD